MAPSTEPSTWSNSAPAPDILPGKSSRRAGSRLMRRSILPRHCTTRHAHLGEATRDVRFVGKDSHPDGDWADRLQPVDAGLAMAPLNDTHPPPLFPRTPELLKPYGLLLYSDSHQKGCRHEPNTMA